MVEIRGLVWRGRQEAQDRAGLSSFSGDRVLKDGWALTGEGVTGGHCS